MEKILAESPMLLLVPAIVAGLLLVAVFLIKKLMYICRPNEVLIFSGRTHKLPDGRSVGFRVISGGRTFRVPMIETVERMQPFYLVRTLGGILFLIGALIMAYNMWRTIRGDVRQETGVVYQPTVAGLAD